MVPGRNKVIQTVVGWAAVDSVVVADAAADRPSAGRRVVSDPCPGDVPISSSCSGGCRPKGTGCAAECSSTEGEEHAGPMDEMSERGSPATPIDRRRPPPLRHHRLLSIDDLRTDSWSRVGLRVQTCVFSFCAGTTDMCACRTRDHAGSLPDYDVDGERFHVEFPPGPHGDRVYPSLRIFLCDSKVICIKTSFSYCI
jgi:hypothetical protein